jgi:hypothetical protein
MPHVVPHEPKETVMTPRNAVAALILLSCLSPAALAEETSYRRVLACQNEDARMEVYVPEKLITGIHVDNAHIAMPVVGLYALDLSDAGKGKYLEPVRVSLTPDKSAVVVDQSTRKLPPTKVPVAGGTVSFDNRFATNTKCGAFNEE